MSNIKNFFFVSAGISLLIWGGDRIYRTWRDSNTEQTSSIRDKRQMDQFYISESERIFKAYFANKGLFKDIQLNDNLKETEKNMIEDGYNHAEAGVIRNIGLSRAQSVNQ